MAELTLHGRPVATVFDLLGAREDDITYSLGWGISRSDALARAMLEEAFGETSEGPLIAIRLQESEAGTGRTDIEIETEHEHLVIEAKRGWTLPLPSQLAKYEERLMARDERARHIAVVAECASDYPPVAALMGSGGAVPVSYIPWARVAELVHATAQATRSQAEKRLLAELHRYLKGVMTMQDVRSNMVYLVSLSTREIAGSSGLSTIDVLERLGRYFCPVGGANPGGWPKEPPNYLGFRYHGRLQQIHHVEGYSIRLAPWEGIPELAGHVTEREHDQFDFELGPVIRPEHPVRTGNLFRAQRVWCALDLLLTCESIREARDKTQDRLTRAGEA
jgi:hypothetical protein